jgi:hypothetical protein
MFRHVKIVSIIILVALCAVATWNYSTTQRPASDVIGKDPRNSGISVFAYHQWFINPNVLVFDLRSISGHNSPLDVSRVLLQYADKLQEKSFSKVILSYKGAPKFMLKGEYFHTLGKEFDSQNPVYTLRTLPENVYNLDNSQAFSTWSGGWIGVVGKQMEDLNDFHKRWYLADLANGS